MYSENDYRYYLAHGKWTWPNGNNSKEYNLWYYQQHKEKWDEYRENAKKKVDSANSRMRHLKNKAKTNKRAAKDFDKHNKETWARFRESNGDVVGWFNKKNGLVYPTQMPPLDYLDNKNKAEQARKRQGEYLNQLYTTGVREASDARNYYEVTKRNSGEAYRSYNAAKQAYDQYLSSPIGKLDTAYKKGKQAVSNAIEKLKRIPLP